MPVKSKKLKDFKKVERKVIELKNWSVSHTYESLRSNKIINTNYSADYVVDGKKEIRFNVSALDKEYAIKRFLKEGKADKPKSYLWGAAGKK